MSGAPLEAWLDGRRQAVDAALDGLLPAVEGPAASVAEAMRYAALGGGKRLRPVLVLTFGEACGGGTDELLAPAAAVEMIHAYSLVHDDLPAMDDDDLRRGRPTAHKHFGEALAILAGDALLTLAFELLAGRPEGDAAAGRRCAATAVAARAAGVAGMVGGQVADVEAEGRPTDAGRLDWIHRHKTGALFAASAEIGAIHGGGGPAARAAAARYGAALGLAFQIADDLLDCSGTAEALGKTPGKDRSAGKATYPALYGFERSRELALQAVAGALAALGDIGAAAPHAERLAALAEFAVARAS